jgi:hypothetical protein
MHVSTAFSELMSTDVTLMVPASELHMDRPVVDLLWIVASICFLVVFTLFVILIVVYVRSVCEPAWAIHGIGLYTTGNRSVDLTAFHAVA